jgi:hypothetical protein
MTQRKPANGNAQGGLDRKQNMMLDSVVTDPTDFYKTFKEFQKHEKLIKENPFDEIFQERAQSADGELRKKEIAINTLIEKKMPSGSDKVNDFINCPICLEMIEDAMETPCCNNIFCEKCIIRTETCPICTRRYNMYQLAPNIPMRRLINEIVISCKNEGCEVQCTKANLTKHNAICEFEVVECPNSPTCKHLLRRNLNEHVTNECEHRIIDCILMCQTKIMINALYDHIHRTCPKALIPCKNNCGEVVERGELIYHVNSKCKNEIISCLYKQTLIYQNG